MALTQDSDFMLAALKAGQTHRGHTWPNPSVGCVLVKDGKIIGAGCTQVGGRPHAEIMALTLAGENARGSTAYVTLEPCNHSHKDKPLSCCDGLINAGVSRVVIAMPDPDARMAGKTIQKLRDADIQVDVGIGFDAAFHAHIGYVTRKLWGRPRVTLKLAHSVDGKIALPGQRVDISSPESWQRTFLQRSKVDAVMVGIGTVLTDNPQLTDRRDGMIAQPLRIIVDTHARLPLSAKIAHENTWLVCADNADTTALEQQGVRIIPCPTSHNRIDMKAALKILGDIGLTHILCEGGAMLAQTLLDTKLVDEALIIEGTNTIGEHGISMPHIDLILRNQDKIGADTWRIYDSQSVLDFTRDFSSKSLPE